jgi:hypothetical protein
MGDRARVVRWVRALLLMELCAFVLSVAGTHGAFAPQPVPPTTTDFASFYSAGLLGDHGRAAEAYDQKVLLATGRAAIHPGVTFNPFLNPPVFLLICAPLAALPYLLAFVLFEAATALLWLGITTRIAGGGRLAAMALAAVPSVWWALGWGQNSFLSASLMGLGTLLLQGRPYLAGAAFGALCFKPHFGILIPVALLAARQWRAIAGAAASVAVLVCLTAACFGAAVWPAFLNMALHARGTIESGKILFEGHVDVAGALRLLGAPAGAGWAGQAAVSLVALGCVAWAWRVSPLIGGIRTQEDAARHAVLCAVLVAGTLTAMPFILFYDLVMAGVAAAWLVRAARVGGWRRGEAAWLAGLMAVDLAAFPAAAVLRLAVGVVVGPGLLWLSMDRFIHPMERRDVKK